MNHSNETRQESPRILPIQSSASRRAGKARGSLSLGALRRCAQWVTIGTLLQASGCAFDSEAFAADTLTALFNNIATTFIITALADLLNVTPSFGF